MTRSSRESCLGVASAAAPAAIGLATCPGPVTLATETPPPPALPPFGVTSGVRSRLMSEPFLLGVEEEDEEAL